MAKVAILMGSDSDWSTMWAAHTLLAEFGVEQEMHVMSAHRTPDAVMKFASSAREQGFGVILAAAGMAAHLAGVVAAHTTLPVIGVPLKGGAMDGMDALLATVQMPPGVPVATVGLNAAKNAALLAVQILGVADSALADRLQAYKEEMARAVQEKDAALQREVQK